MSTNDNQTSGSQGTNPSSAGTNNSAEQSQDQGWQTNKRKKKKGKASTSSNSSTSRGSKFEGAVPELADYVFDSNKPNSSQDLFKTTVRGIAEDVATKYDNAGEFRLGMIEMTLPDLTEPSPPSDANNMVML